MRSLFLACWLASFSLLAVAARPFVTDDARLTTPGSCQLESWTRIYPDSHEFWLLPACNPGGNLEFTLGGGRAWAEGAETSSDHVFQVKTLMRPLLSNDWGIGFAAGVMQHPQSTPGPNQLGNTFAYLPLSASFADDKLILHVNLGWLRDKESGRDNMTWGGGSEIQITSRLTGIAETYGDNRQNVFWQVGGRFSIVPERVQVDATWGRQAGEPASGRWFSLGLRFTPDRLF